MRRALFECLARELDASHGRRESTAPGKVETGASGGGASKAFFMVHFVHEM